jgi:hypothetical protein
MEEIASEVKKPDGYCGCGCGKRTHLATTSDPKTGRKKGEPCFFLPGHNRRKPVRYIEVEMGYETPCWRSQLAINKDGYGVSWNGRGSMSLAHRVQWELEHGPIPDGLEIHHLCGQRNCMNTSHLEILTRREHLVREGRLKLSDEQVRDIRRASGPQWLIALEHGTCQSNVSRIRAGVSRRDVPDEDREIARPPEKGRGHSCASAWPAPSPP